MAITRATVGQLQLDDFVDGVRAVYSGKDHLRSLWDVWLHANHHAAAIGEEVRKGGSGGELLSEIADFSMWLFTVVDKLRGNLGDAKSSNETPQETIIRIEHGYSDLLWNKYPGVCPVCYWRRSRGNRAREAADGFRRPCDCLMHDVERRNQSDKRRHVQTLREYASDCSGQRPTSIDEWQRMFASIYGANLRHLSMSDIAFHLLEEMGEVSDAMIRTYTYKEQEFIEGEPQWRQILLEEEFADVSSWLFALVEKADLIRQTADSYDRWRFGERFVAREPLRLSQIVWKRYGSEDFQSFFCPHGTPQQVCSCPIVLVPATHDVAALLAKVRR